MIDLVPMDSATKRTVAVCLEDAVAKTGAPARSSVTTRPTSMGRSRSSAEQHPETSELYDIKHKAACLLKALSGGG